MFQKVNPGNNVKDELEKKKKSYWEKMRNAAKSVAVMMERRENI